MTTSEGPCGPYDVTAVARATRRILGDDAALGAGQREAVAAVLATDTLAVLPPAAGKSAVYAIAGEVLGGRTVVVSPTLSLHRDQVAHLQAVGVVARALNSDLARGAHAEVLRAFAGGEVEVLVTSPEQLARPDVLDAVERGDPRLFAVDEAHCLCDWGTEFRPDYLALAPVARRVPAARVLALTATAAGPTREHILDLLGIPDACVVVRDVDRPNIHLAGEVVHDEDAKWDRLRRHAADLDGAGIVYVTTRAHTDLVRDLLLADGDTAESYHGGLGRTERGRVQDAFMTGTARVVVATSAFGMGIDKSDVRWVCHGDTPTAVDAYHQEIGRAGRDGGPAHAVLLHRPQDLARPKLFASGRDARAAQLATVVEAVRLHPADGVPLADLAKAAGLSKASLSRALGPLVARGAVTRQPGRRLGAGPAEGTALDLARTCADAVARGREREKSKVELVRRYAEATGCRRRTLLEVLGVTRDEACGYCDHCEAGHEGDPGGRHGTPDAPSPGEIVEHGEWGRGVVATVADDTVVVLFDDAGYRTLSMPVVREHHLLRSA